MFEFDATIEKVKGIDGAFVTFPYDVGTAFGTKGRVKVKATFDGVEYRGTLVRMGTRYHIGLRRDIREHIGKGPGDTVHMTVEEDTAPRVVEAPHDLQEALDQAPVAKAAFEAMSFSHQREYVEAILTSKKPETRKNRIEKTVRIVRDTASQQACVGT